MSLIINTLNKVKKGNEKKYIPPHLVIEKEKTFFKKFRFYFLLSLFFISVGISFYFLFSAQAKIKKSTNSVLIEKSLKEESKEQPIDLEEYGLVLEEPKIIKEDKIKEKQKVKKIVKKQSEIKQPIVRNVEKKQNPIAEKKPEKSFASNFEIITPEKREKIFNKYLLIADKYYLDGKNEKAIEYYEKALYLKNDPSVLNILLNLYIQEGKIKQVVKTLTNSKLSIQNEDATSALIIEMIDKGYKKEANQILSKIVVQDKNGYLLYSKGYLEEKEGNIKNALYFYQKAYKKNKIDPFISYSYGRLEERNKNYQKALQIYKNIIEKNPEHRLSKKLKEKLKNLTNL
jgi:tetratricopeptide (TPR) repeat protein